MDEDELTAAEQDAVRLRDAAERQRLRRIAEREDAELRRLREEADRAQRAANRAERDTQEQRRLQEQADRAKRELAKREERLGVDPEGLVPLEQSVAEETGDGASGEPTETAPGGVPGEAVPETEPLTTELTAEQQEFFRKQFGGLSLFMEKAELYDVVLQVAREGITDVNRVLGLVQETDWYQNNSALTRRFDVLYAEEGDAGQRELIDDQYETINSAARNVGFVIEDDRLQELAYQASRLGLDAGEVADLIAAEQNFDPGYLGDSAKQLANKYYISLDDASADEYGTQLFVGDMNQQMLESMFREQAKGRFPSLANIIDSGVSPQTYFAPYKAQIAQLLEIDANQVDLMNDTRFSTIIDHIPEAGGEARPMTMNEMQRYVRRLDDWQYTDNAKASASRLADAIGARFGRTA